MRFCYIWVKRNNVIIGIDWLGKNQAFIDCKRKRVLRGPRKSDMRFVLHRSLLEKSYIISLIIRKSMSKLSS